jgi:hypothetical protein
MDKDLKQPKEVVCSLCEAGNVYEIVSGVFVHVVPNCIEGKTALVECALSPIHIERLIKAPKWEKS